MQEMFMNLKDAAIQYAPSLGAAVLILVVGWLIAVILSTIIRSILAKTALQKSMANWFYDDTSGSGPDIPRAIGKAVFWVIILLTLVSVTQALGVTVAGGPLSGLASQLFEFLPKILAAGLLFIVAWIIARIVRVVATKVLSAAGVDQKLSKSIDAKSESEFSISKSVGETLYWFVFLLFLPAILGALQMEGILAPIQAMLDRFLLFLPNLVGAAVIVAVGWFVARIVRSIVSNLIAAAGGDKLTEKFGIAPLSRIGGLVVYVVILVPIMISALNALQLEAIATPASEMLTRVLTALPNILAALMVMGIGFMLGRFLSRVVSQLLAGIGVNSLPGKLGFVMSTPETGRKLSDIAGVIVLTAIMLFTVLEAAGLLGFVTLSAMISELTVFGGKILLGVVIIAIGLYLSNLAATAVRASSTSNNAILATITRVAILVVVGSMAVRQMGIADEIINLAFGLTLGAVAVASAIAFGIGGRDVAAKKLAEWTREKR